MGSVSDCVFKNTRSRLELKVTCFRDWHAHTVDEVREMERRMEENEVAAQMTGVLLRSPMCCRRPSELCLLAQDALRSSSLSPLLNANGNQVAYLGNPYCSFPGHQNVSDR